MLIISLFSLATYFPCSGESIHIDDTTVAAFLVDLTTIYILFDMIHSAYRIKRILYPGKDQQTKPMTEQSSDTDTDMKNKPENR